MQLNISLIIVFLLLGTIGNIPFSSSSLIDVYDLTFSYEDGNVYLEDIKIIKSFPSNEFDFSEEGYLLKIISFDNENYYDFKFNFKKELFVNPGFECFDDEGNFDFISCPDFRSLRDISQESVFLRMPFSPGAKLLNVYDPQGKLLLSEDISYLSCGNKICEDHETIKNCFGDCYDQNINYVYVFVILVFLLLILFFILKSKNK